MAEKSSSESESSQDGTKVDKLEPAQYQALQAVVSPHIESFNFAMGEGLWAIAENIGPRMLKLPINEPLVMTLAKVNIGVPTSLDSKKVFPAECRQLCKNYEADLTVTVKWDFPGQGPSYTNEILGQVPIMVKSKKCHLADLTSAELVDIKEDAQECGGYFIVNGKERGLRMLLRPRRNFPMTIVKPNWKGGKKSRLVNTDYGIELHCVGEDQTASTITLHFLNADQTCDLETVGTRWKHTFPVLVVLRALWDESDEEMKQALMVENEEGTSMRGFINRLFTQEHPLSEWLTSQMKALEFIGKRFKDGREYGRVPDDMSLEDVGRQILKELVCVHLSENYDKFHLLVFMIRKLFALQSGKCGVDFLRYDSPKAQEVVLGGQLYLMALKQELVDYFKYLEFKLSEEIRKAQRRFDAADVEKVVSDSKTDFFRAMKYFLESGNSGFNRFLQGQAGQTFHRYMVFTVNADKANFYRYLLQFRHIYRPKLLSLDQGEARGFLCPAKEIEPNGKCQLSTPNFLAALCTITTKQPDTRYVTRVLSHHKMEAIGHHSVKILLDGKVVGTISPDNAVAMVTQVQEQKSMGLDQIPPTLEIGYVPFVKGGQYPGLYLFTSPARMVRPILNLETQRTELIGSFEQACMDTIALNTAEIVKGHTTHRELHELKSMCRYALPSYLMPINPSSDIMMILYECECLFCHVCKSFLPAIMENRFAIATPYKLKCPYCTLYDGRIGIVKISTAVSKPILPPTEGPAELN